MSYKQQNRKTSTQSLQYKLSDLLKCTVSKLPEKCYSTYLYSVQTLHLFIDTYASIILWRDKQTLNGPDSIYGIYGQRFVFPISFLFCSLDKQCSSFKSHQLNLRHLISCFDILSILLTWDISVSNLNSLLLKMNTEHCEDLDID